MRTHLCGTLLITVLSLGGCSALQQAPTPNDTVSRNINEMKARPRPPVVLPDEREGRIASLSQQLSDRDAELARLRQGAGDLSTANRRIKDLEGQLGDRDRELASLRQGAGDLTGANRRIGELETQLTDRDRELAGLRQGAGDLTAANRKVSELEQQLTERDAELGRLRQAAADRDRLTSLATASANDLEDTKRRLAEQTKQLDGLNAKLSERDQELARLNALAQQGQGSADELARSRQQLASLSGTLSERDQEILRLRSQLDQKQVEKDLLKALQPEIKAGHVSLNQAGEKLTINVASAALFDSGKDELKPAGVDVLKRVGGILKEFPQQTVHVAGYTDSVPIRGALAKKFPSNQELSDARAQHAATLLESSGVAKSNLTAAGHGDSHPVADNKNADGRSKNRRVEIVVSAK